MENLCIINGDSFANMKEEYVTITSALTHSTYHL